MLVVFREKMSFFNALILGLLCFADPVSADDPVPSPQNSPPDNGAVAKLVEELGSVHWRNRERATQVMMNQGPELYEPLRNAFRSATGHEVRKRIKQIIREIYVAQIVGPGSAFLGIQHTGRAERSQSVSRVPPGSSGILIDRVFPLTAADRAGLRSGDLVLSLNGERATGKRSALDFTAWIGSQKVGTPCRLGVLRGGTGIHLNHNDTPDFDPRAFSNLETSIVRHEDDPRIPKGAAAFRVEGKMGEPGRLSKLAEGDLLIAMDGRPIPLENTAEIFSRWTQGERIVEAPEPPLIGPVQGMFRIQGNPAPNNPGDNSGRSDRVPSVQILRGGNWIEFEVVLGRRPDYLPDWRTGRGAKSVNEAVASFETWWDEWLKSAEMVTDQFDADVYWLLEP